MAEPVRRPILVPASHLFVPKHQKPRIVHMRSTGTCHTCGVTGENLRVVNGGWKYEWPEGCRCPRTLAFLKEQGLSS